MNFYSDGIDEYDEMVGTLYGRGSYIFASKKLDIDMKNKTTHPTRLSIEEPSVLELKALLSYLWYVFLSTDNTLLMIIAVILVEIEVEVLLLVF